MNAPQKNRARQLAQSLLIVGLFLSGGHALAETRVSLPDFSLRDIEQQTWHLADHAGQPKLLMFWATWCPHCKRLFPTIQTLHEQYQSHGLEVAAISVFDDGDTGAYASEYGLTMHVLNDGDAIATQLSIPGTPTVVVLNGQNDIVYGAVNPDPADPVLEQVIRGLLSEAQRSPNTHSTSIGEHR